MPNLLKKTDKFCTNRNKNSFFMTQMRIFFLIHVMILAIVLS